MDTDKGFSMPLLRNFVTAAAGVLTAGIMVVIVVPGSAAATNVIRKPQ
ncbi:hypothetical protein [Saccharothrix deserti]|nr:hypothetical protein [Saccharothrix deserti]